MSFDELLSSLTPYRPRLREDMPLLEWAEEYRQNGFLTIDAYTSHKSKENPNGYKISKIKACLLNGYSSMTDNERKLVRDAFSDAWFSTTLDANNHRQFVIATKEFMEHAKKQRNWKIDPLVVKIKRPSSTETKIDSNPTAETSTEDKPETPTKSRKKKKST